jgi:nicotinamidase-related amidase
VENVALVVVDVQRDFLDANSPPGVGSWEKAFCVPGVERLLAYARQHGWRVVHVGTKHSARETLPLHHREKGIDVYCQEGTDGCDFIVPPADETTLFKHWYSAFDADLEPHVAEAQAIVWAGVASDCCIQQSAFEADRREIHSIVPYQAVSASHRPAFVGSLVGMAKSVCDVVDLDDVLSGSGVHAPALEVDDIEARSRSWYSEQSSRLADGNGLTLEVVLERLGDVAARER